VKKLFLNKISANQLMVLADAKFSSLYSLDKSRFD